MATVAVLLIVAFFALCGVWAHWFDKSGAEE